MLPYLIYRKVHKPRKDVISRFRSLSVLILVSEFVFKPKVTGSALPVRLQNQSPCYLQQGTRAKFRIICLLLVSFKIKVIVRVCNSWVKI